MKDCTTCKYGFVDEQLGFPMCHHPLRWSEDCVDFNMHEEKKEPKKATGIVEKKLSDELEDAARKYGFEEYRRRCEDGNYGTSEDAFIAGAQYAFSRWISVDERLPEMDEEVIVLTDELDTAPIYKIGFGHIVDVKRCIDYNGWNIPGVKYWMPCPKIPNND